jgi:uncharacterized protein (DUF302 family)
MVNRKRTALMVIGVIGLAAYAAFGRWQGKYGMSTRLSMSHEVAVKIVKEALNLEGLSVLSVVDVRKTVKETMGEVSPKYVIITTCDPRLLHRALSADLETGILMPTQIGVYETGGGVIVSINDSTARLLDEDNDELKEIAVEVQAKLADVMKLLSQSQNRWASLPD